MRLLRQAFSRNKSEIDQEKIEIKKELQSKIAAIRKKLPFLSAITRLQAVYARTGILQFSRDPELIAASLARYYQQIETTDRGRALLVKERKTQAEAFAVLSREVDVILSEDKIDSADKPKLLLFKNGFSANTAPERINECLNSYLADCHALREYCREKQSRGLIIKEAFPDIYAELIQIENRIWPQGVEMQIKPDEKIPAASHSVILYSLEIEKPETLPAKFDPSIPSPTVVGSSPSDVSSPSPLGSPAATSPSYSPATKFESKKKALMNTWRDSMEPKFSGAVPDEKRVYSLEAETDDENSTIPHFPDENNTPKKVDEKFGPSGRHYLSVNVTPTSQCKQLERDYRHQLKLLKNLKTLCENQTAEIFALLESEDGFSIEDVQDKIDTAQKTYKNVAHLFQQIVDIREEIFRLRNQDSPRKNMQMRHLEKSIQSLYEKIAEAEENLSAYQPVLLHSAPRVTLPSHS